MFFSRNNAQSLFGCDHLRLGLSPSPAKSPRTSMNSAQETHVGEPEPLIPDLCLDLLWTETSITKPSKVFLMEDSVGQKFLCLLLPQIQSLRCIKYEIVNDSSSVVYGAVASLPARDAAPISLLKMMIVVDCSNFLSLYTGITQVSYEYLIFSYFSV